MRAFMVSVDYTDILSITLPANRHHFEQVTIVTSTGDAPNVYPLAGANGAGVVVTDLFYENGAQFAKWAALEYALDVRGRHGIICLMDADILWPKVAPISVQKGYLLTPFRRMFEDTSKPIPHESCWELYPQHPNINEHAGYSQIFHGDDPHLPSPPWHDTRWKHCGGADSFFQALWPSHKRTRPDWECLHLGPAGKNWFGRATRMLDGTIPAEAEGRLRMVDKLWRDRRRNSNGPNRFAGEKIT